MAHLDQLFELSPEAMVLEDVNYHIIRVNQEFSLLFGFRAGEAVGRTLADLIVPNEFRGELVEEQRFTKAGQRIEREAVRRAKSGARINVSVVAAPVVLSDGEAGVVLTYRDITQRKHAESLLEGQATVLEMVTRSVPLDDVLNTLVHVIESQADGMLCSVLFLNEDGVHVRHGAAPSLPRSYTNAINGAAIGPEAGSCGTAAFRGETVIVQDIENDPLWANWREVALKHGLRACWSTPIRAPSGKVVGMFAMYYRQVRSPEPVELKLIEVAAHLAGIAIERNQREQALLESRNELQQVTSSISDSLWSAGVTADGKFICRYCSPVIERISGRPPGGYKDMPEAWLRVVHPDDRSRVALLLERLVSGQSRSEEQEYRIVLPDSSVRWVRDSIRTTPTENAGVLLHGVLSDVTERRQAEEALRHSQQLLQNIVDGAHAIVYVKDCEGRYLLVNRRFSETFHVSREDVLGKTDYELFPPDNAELYRRNDQQALTTGAFCELEETVKLNDEEHTYLTVKNPLRDKEGELFAVCGISTDITERKHLEERLRDAQKMEAVGRLAGGIAHDFNNLMTVVTGYSEMLRSALDGDAELLDKVEEIHKAGVQAGALTRQLLAFSRRQVLQPKLLNLNEVLEHMFSMLRRVLSEDIELDFSLDSALGLIRSDRGQIEQVIMNLIINARDAMATGGKITLATTNSTWSDETMKPPPGGEKQSCVRLTVSDTGHGMDPATKSRMFEPFFTTKPQGEGTGLGLATVYAIVQQAGGMISVQTALGRGTTFHIYFPLVTGKVTIEASRPSTQPVGGSETVLVAEDQDGLRALTTEVLRRHGYRVLTAAEGKEALVILEQYAGTVDLLITDLIMPLMGGRELAERLPRVHPETKLLYISGYFEGQDELLRNRLAFLEKPFTPESLLRKVREVLDGPTSIPRSA